MHDVLGRFFPAVVGPSLALGTGVWRIGRLAKQEVELAELALADPYGTNLGASSRG